MGVEGISPHHQSPKFFQNVGGIITQYSPTPLTIPTPSATRFYVIKPHEKPARKWRGSGGVGPLFLVGNHPPDPSGFAAIARISRRRFTVGGVPGRGQWGRQSTPSDPLDPKGLSFKSDDDTEMLSIGAFLCTTHSKKWYPIISCVFPVLHNESEPQ